VVNADGVYTEVTDLARWSTSNPGVMRIDPSFPSTWVMAVSAGTADVIATYQNLSGSYNTAYGGFPQPVPRIVFSFSGSAREVGATERLTATLVQTQSSVDLTGNAGVVWTSSNPEVATVVGDRLTAVGVGSTQITATYQGVTSWYRFSIFPRRFGRTTP